VFLNSTPKAGTEWDTEYDMIDFTFDWFTPTILRLDLVQIATISSMSMALMRSVT